MHRTAQRLTTEKALVAEVDLWVTTTKEKLAARLAREIADILGISGKAKEIARVFGSLRVRPIVTVEDDGSFGFSFAAGHTVADVDDTLERLLRMLGETAASRKRPVVLILDEFQEIVEIDPGLTKLMRSVFQEQPEVAHSTRRAGSPRSGDDPHRVALMRVLVTGGTGFVGSHSAKALVDAGHEVRLLVRAPDRIAPALAPHGIDALDHVVGDVTDPDAVAKALDGCDAVVHAANVYKLDSRAAQEMLHVNPRGTELVLRGAHERGLDPIVHVSTHAALLPSHEPVLTRDSPLGSPPGAYARSKVAAERVARELQGEGAPVVTVNPGGVLGPHDPYVSDYVLVALDVLRGRIPWRMRGATPAADVRDVAAVHAAVLEPGRGPRRYLVSAGRLSLEDLRAEARRLTGRRIPALPLPGPVALATGRAADLAQRALPVRLPVSFEAPWVMLNAVDADSSATTDELGVRLRPLRESIADTYRWLAQAGHLSPRMAGRLSS